VTRIVTPADKLHSQPILVAALRVWVAGITAHIREIPGSFLDVEAWYADGECSWLLRLHVNTVSSRSLMQSLQLNIHQSRYRPTLRGLSYWQHD
jgi:hypothetical protein